MVKNTRKKAPMVIKGLSLLKCLISRGTVPVVFFPMPQLRVSFVPKTSAFWPCITCTSMCCMLLSVVLRTSHSVA